MTPILEWPNVDFQTFRRENLPAGQPVVLRGLVRHWSLVQQARQSPESVCRHLLQHASDQLVDAIMVPPDQHGRVGLDASCTGFNFIRNRITLHQAIEQLARYSHFDTPPAMAVQSAPIGECLPGLAAELSMPALPDTALPRIWIGNAIVTPTHFDESRNIACAVAGRRRFILFPPDQIANLYLGPLDKAPTLTPISLADPTQWDTARFPKLGEALALAQITDLEPGDALFIPPLWWHHVTSQERLNILVNYWWREDRTGHQTDSALGALWHAVLSLRQLPEAERRTWAGLFEHFVFGPAEAATAHLPEAAHGMLGDMNETQRAQLRLKLAELLAPKR
jgi:hypothetical protein